MRRYLTIALMLARMHIRSRMEYRGAVILSWVAMGFSYTSVYTAIALVVYRFGNLGGWQWPEMALLLAFHLLGYSIGASLSFTQLRDLEDQVQRGSFDAVLIKPVGAWTYLIFSGLNIGYVSHMIVALGFMAWALTQVSIDWSAPTVLYFIATIISTAMIVAAIMTMIGATALVWVRSRHLYAIFFGFWELARYPLVIFQFPLQILMLTAAPLGFMAYVPVAVLLGKDVAVLGPWAGIASLLAGPLWVLIAAMHWRSCLRNYQGAGG